jgi:hypothetical protein
MNEAHKAALAAGRERAKAKRREGAEVRVNAWRQWCKDDAKWYSTGKQGPRPQMPPLPSSYDYRVVEGTEDDDA